MKLYYFIFLELILHHHSEAFPSKQSNDVNNTDKDNDTSKKIIGSSVVTSVSVVLNGEEPQFTDAIGQRMPKPQIPLQVASPINLLNPDRYEFFTFDDSGQLVKRLMTLKEIQSIVANGDGEGATVIHNAPIDDRDPDKNVKDIVASVQSVLTKEVEGKKNFSISEQHILDTPDVSSSWSMILPAIFGNTGGDIFPQSKPQQVVMTPDSDVLEQRPTKPTKKPSKSKPTKRRTTTSTTSTTPKIVETTIPQKVFVNNKEVVKPLFNRLSVKNGLTEETTLIMPVVAISQTTLPTTSVTKRKKKPPKPTIEGQITTKKSGNKRKTTPAIINIISASTSTTKQNLTTNIPESTTKKRHQSSSNKRKTTARPTSTVVVTSEGTIGTQTTKRVQTKRKPTKPTEQQKNTTLGEINQTTTKQKYKKKHTTTTRVPSQNSTQKYTEVQHSTTEIEKTKIPLKISTFKPTYFTKTNLLTSSSTPTTSTSKITTQAPEIATTTRWNIDETPMTTLLSQQVTTSYPELQKNELIQQQEDLNTKISFDQIMESLKYDEDSTDTVPIDHQTVQPVLYNNAEQLEEVKLLTKPTFKPITTIRPKFKTTTNVYPIDITTKLIEEQTTNWSNEIGFEKDGSNVIKYEPLFAELFEPILTDLTTTEIPITSTDHMDVGNYDDFLKSDETTMSNEYFDSTKIPNEQVQEDQNIYKVTHSQNIANKIHAYSNTIKSNLENKTIENILYNPQDKSDESFEQKQQMDKEILQKIQNLINQNKENFNTDKPIVEEMSQHKLNTLNHQHTYDMSMSDFRKTAATLASMLENESSSETSEITTENNLQDNLEIQSLLSDVLSQMTDSPKLSNKNNDNNYNNNNNKTSDDEVDENNEKSSNRFTNFAQMSAGIFLPSELQNANANDKFHFMEKLSLKLNETKDTIIPSNLPINKNENEFTITTTDAPTISDDVQPFTEQKLFIQKIDAKVEKQNQDSTTTIPLLDDDDDDGNVSDDGKDVENNFKEYYTTMQSEVESETILQEKEVEVKKKSEQENIDLLGATTTIIAPVDIASSSSESIQITSVEMKNQNDDDDDDADFGNNLTTTELAADIELESKESKDSGESLTLKNPDSLVEVIHDIPISTEREDISKELSTESPLEDSNESTTASYEQSSEEVSTDHMTLVNLISQSNNQDVKVTQSAGIFNITEAEDIYAKLGEFIKKPNDHVQEQTTTVQISKATPSSTKLPQKLKPSTLKPVHYFKQPSSQTDQKLISFNGVQQRPVVRPPSLTNLKVTHISQATRVPVKLEPTPEKSLGLEASVMDLEEDIQEFARLCNELAFNYWRSITSEKISPARSLVLSPFALTSMLSMVFLGARGSTSGEMNEILRLDDMVTFNPHLVFKNITESVELAKDSDIASSAFVREVFSERTNGKILQFFKEKTQQLYSGHVEEVNFNVVNDIIRRRTNLLIKKHTNGKIMEYLRTNSVWVNGPLSTVSANLFQTDCTRGSTNDRDGEMFFQVSPSIRQRRLIPIPAVVWRSRFTAGYDPELDATAVAFGSSEETVSTIYVMPGQHGLAAPGDNLERLEKNIMENGISKNAWSHLLTTLMERPGLEVQLPRFSHRSFINASLGLQKLGLKTLFNSDNADLRGLTGSSNKDVYLSDMIQINTFSTCGEEKIGEHHHVEMYPAPPLRKRNSDIGENNEDFLDETQIDFGSLIHDSARGFYDDLLDPKYLELPLPLRPRQARIPDAPRLRFDKPFLYFVRHNPTGMILYMGRFNPRLLP